MKAILLPRVLKIIRNNKVELWNIGAVLLLDELEETKQRLEGLPDVEQKQIKNIR